MSNQAGIYTDQELFPGWNFEVTKEEKIKTQPVKFLQDSLNKMSVDEKKAFERAIVGKHTRYGAVSMFKNIDEMQFAKSRSIAKNEIIRIRMAIDQCENDISDLEKQLSEGRVTYLALILVDNY